MSLSCRIFGGKEVRAAGKSLGFVARKIRGQWSSVTGVRAAHSLVDDYYYNQEQQELQKSVRKIIENDINPHVEEWEAKEIFPAKDVFKKLASAGFLGINKPTEYGGMGLDYKYQFAFLEELGSINCGGVAMGIMVQTDIVMPALSRFGSDKLKEEFLAPSISGDMVLCLGVSEPGAGSDVANITTRAEKRGDDLIINGEKLWISNGCQADWICLLANTSKGNPYKCKSLICVPMKTPGVQLVRKIDKMGMKSSDTAHLRFEDVRVPAANIIGEEGMGFVYQMLQFQEERMAGAALALKPMERCIQETVEYAGQRKAFGATILHNQYVHYRLAELLTEVEAFRSLAYRTVDLYTEGNDMTLLASMCKLKAGRLVREVADSCLQFWGGMGYTNEVLVSRYFRDLRLMSIGGGADEVMLGIICKLAGLLPKKSSGSH